MRGALSAADLVGQLYDAYHAGVEYWITVGGDEPPPRPRVRD